LQDIIDRYAHLTRNTPYLLPIITQTDGTEYKQYRNREECINRALKSIGVAAGLKIPLTTYVARHSWASIARNMNFSIAIISEGMGHQSYRTTQIYLDSIDTARIDDANNRIIHRISMGK
ncbi:MAG: tyrosine-type recombinase/integrase, partial [Prevotella sp.]|nr:tyrosine-type recombinase/integrase [Prevotella sp.]